MLIAAIIVIGVLLLLALILAVARRSDQAQAVGVLSRETRKRDRCDAAIAPLEAEAPVLSGRQVEKQAALERAGSGSGSATAVVIAGSRAPVLPASPPPVDLE